MPIGRREPPRRDCRSRRLCVLAGVPVQCAPRSQSSGSAKFRLTSRRCARTRGILPPGGWKASSRDLARALAAFMSRSTSAAEEALLEEPYRSRVIAVAQAFVYGGPMTARACVLVFCLFWASGAALAQDVPSAPVLRIEPGMHTAPIIDAGTDQSRDLLVTGGLDNTVRIWSLPELRLVRVLRPPIGSGWRRLGWRSRFDPGREDRCGRWLASCGIGPVRDRSVRRRHWSIGPPVQGRRTCRVPCLFRETALSWPLGCPRQGFASGGWPTELCRRIETSRIRSKRSTSVPGVWRLRALTARCGFMMRRRKTRVCIRSKRLQQKLGARHGSCVSPPTGEAWRSPLKTSPQWRFVQQAIYRWRRDLTSMAWRVTQDFTRWRGRSTARPCSREAARLKLEFQNIRCSRGRSAGLARGVLRRRIPIR